MSKLLRTGAIFCAVLMVFVVFQGHDTLRLSPLGVDYNYALASNGGRASASGFSGTNGPGNAIDGAPVTYWQSANTTGWLAVQFRTQAYINVVKAHFSTIVYRMLSLYLDTNGNGLYESGEKVASWTSNTGLDVTYTKSGSPAFAFGMQITIDLANGANNPKINEFEAFLQGDSDGDGLTDSQEAGTTYYQDAFSGSLPESIPDDGVSVAGAGLSLAQFYGTPARALANFTIDHPNKGDLSATVGYWNGTAWIDRAVWDPGLQVQGIRITQPNMFTYYSGNVTAAATVRNPLSTSKVEFRVNGVLKATVTSPVGNEFRWNWNTTSLGDSLPTLNATRYDVNGSKAWNQIIVKANNLPPTVAWLSPGNNTRADGNVTLLATGSDFHGIARIDFYLDDVKQASVPSPNAGPNNYSWVWQTEYSSNGWRTLKAVAFDAGGVKSASAVRTVFKNAGFGIQIIRPTPTAYYEGIVAVVAKVNDPSVTSKVEFRVDGVLKGTVTTTDDQNYTWNWTTANEDALRVVNVTQYDPIGPGAWDQMTARVNHLPPALSWLSPIPYATVHDRVMLKVKATDFYGIQKVRFYADGVLIGEDMFPDSRTNNFTWSWSTSLYCSNSQHTLSATAIENTDMAKSATSFITVNTNTDPLVCITSPTGGMVSGTVQVQTSTASTVGIMKVEFYLGAHAAYPGPVLKFTDTTAPYSWSWDTTTSLNGPYQIEVVAYNYARKTDAAVVTVYVNNIGHDPGPGAGPPSPWDSSSQIFGVLTRDWTLGESDVGFVSTVVVDLVNPQSTASPGENASGILRPALPSSLFFTALQWRLIVRDWSQGAFGNLTAFTLRFEAKSDPQVADTDGDGIPDGTEVNKWHTLPITRDSDLDGLNDDYEITPHTLTISVGGVSSILTGVTSNPAAWDTDGDGLSDGQERGVVTTGQSKVIGEVGRVTGVGGTCTTGGVKSVFLRNGYTTPVVIAEPATKNEADAGVVRLTAVTDHTFAVCFQEWSGSTVHAGESVDYLVLEAGNHILTDGTLVEAGKVGAGTAFASFSFRESFAQSPILLAQIQSYVDSHIATARVRSVSWFGFDTRIRVNAGDSHPSEKVGYVAVMPPSNPTNLSTWTRGSLDVGASTNPATVVFPKRFSAVPRVLAWYATEGSPVDLSLRIENPTNASISLRRELDAGSPSAESLHWFAFASSMNLTARMTTRPNGTGSADTDGDTLSDGTEIRTYGTNPTLKDTDSDGIPDNVELTDRVITIPVNGSMRVFTLKTSPTSDDTDSDGVKDPEELNGVLDHRLLYYDMETTLADGRLRDWSGNGLPGTIVGPNTTGGKVGIARWFSGSNYAELADSPILDPAFITVAAWVSISGSAGANNPVVTKGQDGADFQYYMEIRKVGSVWKLNAQVKSDIGTSVSVTSTNSLPTGWAHVAFTFDGVAVQLYINGAADGSPATLFYPIRTTTQPLRIGHYFGSPNYFKGAIDEVQIWDRALSPDEIAQYAGPDLPVMRLDMETVKSDGKLADFAGKGNAGTSFATSVLEGRIGFARRFSSAASSVNVTDSASLNFNATGLTISGYVLTSSAPASDVSIVAKRGELYLNLSSDGLAHFTIYGKTPLSSLLPLPLNRWVRVSAASDATSMSLYFDDVLMATSAGAKPSDTPNQLTLGYAEGCSLPCPHFQGALDEFVVYAKALSKAILDRSSARGILLNPNATDTDFDGLPDGQEVFVKTVKTLKRYPTKDQIWVSTDAIALDLGIPGWAIQSVQAMVGFTHEDMGQLQAYLERWTGSAVDLQILLRNYGNAGQSSNFTSYDLLQKPALGGSQLARDDVVTPGRTWYVKAYDSTVNKQGQIEYLQILVAAHSLPNRADTDGDGLSDSEEMSLGSDGFQTNPWKADTDSDGVTDSLELGGWMWSGSTIVASPTGTHTDPTRADTDRDGVLDGNDRAPLGDAFVRIWFQSARIYGGSDDDTTPSIFEPFVSVKVGNQTTYSAHWDVSSGDQAFLPIDYVANVPDDQTNIPITVEVWDYDGFQSNGYPDDTHERFAVSGSSPTWTFNHPLGASGVQSYSSGGTGSFRAEQVSLTVQTLYGYRMRSYMIVPLDYSGLSNVTNATGSLLARRYVGEPRFVAMVLNVSRVVPRHVLRYPEVIFVPRSVFFDTLLYKRLATQDTSWPLTNLVFRRNLTSASWNSDDLQAILSGNVTGVEEDMIIRLLKVNTTAATRYRVIDAESGNAPNTLFMFTLPDAVLRLIGYMPFSVDASVPYRFCSTPNCGVDPTPPTIWEQIWNGIVSTVTGWIASAIVLASNAFAKLVAVMAQVGSWAADLFSGDPVRVARAVQAAQTVAGSLVDWIKRAAIESLEAALQALLSAGRRLLDATVGDFASDIALSVKNPGQAPTIAPSSADRLFRILIGLAAIPLAMRAAEAVLMVASFGVEWLVSKLISKTVAEFVVKTLALAALSLTAATLLGEVLESVGWAEQSAVEFFKALGFPVTLVAGATDIAFVIFTKLFAKLGPQRLILRWLGFALALFSIVMAVAGEIYVTGAGLFVVDLAGVLTAYGGLSIYILESDTVPQQALDIFSSISPEFEKAVVYGSLPVSAAAILVHGGQLKYG